MYHKSRWLSIIALSLLLALIEAAPPWRLRRLQAPFRLKRLLT